MSRVVPEWVATHDDQAIPPKVKLRVWTRCEGKCALSGRKLRPGDPVNYDHIKPLRDGGEHREGNLQLVSVEAHRVKTAAEAGQRAKEERIRLKHFGLKAPSKRKIPAHVNPWGRS